MSVLPVCRNVLLSALACLACLTARATSVRPPQFADLVARADCVVRVETLATRSEWRGDGAARRIVTLVTMHVLRPVVGSVPETIELEFLGGTVDGRTLRVTDQPRFQAGDRDVLFIEGNGRQFCPLVSMGYGRYPVRRDPADASRELVTREDGTPLRAVTEVSQPFSGRGPEANAPRARPASPSLSVGEFEEQIRRTAAGLGRKDARL